MRSPVDRRGIAAFEHGARLAPRASQEPRLWHQYWKLAGAAAPRTLVFCRVGAFVEFRGPFVAEAAAVLGLRPLRLHRGTWAFGAGFPIRALPRYEKAAVTAGWSAVVVRESEWRGRRACRARAAVRIVRPAAFITGAVSLGRRY